MNLTLKCITCWCNNFSFKTEWLIGRKNLNLTVVWSWGYTFCTGNGEKGDFSNKRHGIQGISEDDWIANLAELLWDFMSSDVYKLRESSKSKYKKSPKLFVATDSGNPTKLVEQLQHSIKQEATKNSIHKNSTTLSPLRIPEVVIVGLPGVAGVSFAYSLKPKMIVWKAGSHKWWM